jgi:hypothetical protein
MWLIDRGTIRPGLPGVEVEYGGVWKRLEEGSIEYED